MSGTLVLDDPLFADALVLDDGALGVLPAEIPLTGQHGGGILAGDPILPAEAGSEFSLRITSGPSDVVLIVEDDTSFTATPPSQSFTGTRVWTFDAFKDGVLYGDEQTLTITWGAAVPPPPPPVLATALRFDFPGESLFIRIT